MSAGGDPDRPYRLRRKLRSLSLRSRLLVGLILVAMVGLIAANSIVYAKIETYLVGQLDQQLPPAQSQLYNSLSHPFSFNNTPAGTYGAFVSGSGDTIEHYDATPTNPTPAYPSAVLAHVLQTPIPTISAGPPPASEDTYFTTGSVGNPSFRYRVLAAPVAVTVLGNPETVVVVVAYPLSSLDAILHQLVLLDAGVGAALLIVLGMLGVVVVRIGLRPLAEIEETAGAIASGDLTRRVDREEETTEVGRLGASLNVMLETIERSFSEQQASAQRLRQFLADASHELRTPVTSIRGYSELFRRGAADRPEDLAASMRRIEEESIRMGVLVDDLLLLARLDEGRPLEQGSVDVALIAADAASDAEVVQPGRPLRLDLDGPLVVVGDEQRLRQVVTNLLQNALRYTSPDVPITITAKRDGEQAILTIADEGVGIASEHLPHLFERFYRADPSRTRESGGSGLGLAIVASIVEAHGGSVHAESELGRGSTFTVTLPLAPASEVRPHTNGATASPIAESEDGAPEELTSSQASEELSGQTSP